MNVKILLTLSMLLILGGCSNKTTEPVTVYYPVETIVTAKCEAPEVVCKYNEKGITAKQVVREMYQCIIDLRKALEVCR